MKKLHPLLSVLFLIYWGCSNPDPVDFHSLVQRNGIYYELNSDTPYSGQYYNKDLIKIEGSIKEGKLHGINRTYYITGELEIEQNYKNGMLNGPFKSFFKNGVLKNEGLYENDKTIGVWKTFHENGELESEKSFSQGIIDGTFKLYFEDGELREEKNYKNGQLIGDYQSRWGPDKYLEIGTYKGIKDNREYKRYTQDGELFSEGSVENDIEKGRRYMWGFVIEEWISKNGLPQGYTTYRGSGEIESKSFFSNGNKIKEIVYKDNGEIYYVTEWNEDGSVKK